MTLRTHHLLSVLFVLVLLGPYAVMVSFFIAYEMFSVQEAAPPGKAAKFEGGELFDHWRVMHPPYDGPADLRFPDVYWNGSAEAWYDAERIRLGAHIVGLRWDSPIYYTTTLTSSAGTPCTGCGQDLCYAASSYTYYIGGDAFVPTWTPSSCQWLLR